MEVVFFISLTLLIYIYFGYPLLLMMMGIFRKPLVPCDGLQLPSVVVVIAAYNEEANIEKTIENKLAQKYDASKLTVVVISDSSSDKTDEIVNRIGTETDRVTLLRQKMREGKTSALNLARHHINADIIVFSDANSIYSDNAIYELVKVFNNPKVGYVTGKMVYVNSEGSLVGDGCSAYMKYENKLREFETQFGSVVGVDGGIDAMRSHLFKELNADQLPDFVQPLWTVRQGYEVKYCSTALLKENALNESGAEFRMRVRVSLRALWALYDMRVLFNPVKYGWFSLQLFSHKLLRYLAVVFMFTALMSNLALAPQSIFFLSTLCLQSFFYLLAFTGYKKTNFKSPLFSAPYYFCLINLACMWALFKFFRGQKIVTWTPREG